MKQPSSFIPGAGGSFYDRMQATPPPRIVEVPAPAPAPLPPAPPTLSVKYPNLCTLSKGLLAAVPHLKAGGRVLLTAPIEKGGKWHLYTKPAQGSGSKIPERGPAAFRTHAISRMLFMRPQPIIEARRYGFAGVANQNVFNPTLRFVLGPEVPTAPGCYELLRQPHAGAVDG